MDMGRDRRGTRFRRRAVLPSGPAPTLETPKASEGLRGCKTRRAGQISKEQRLMTVRGTERARRRRGGGGAAENGWWLNGERGGCGSKGRGGAGRPVRRGEGKGLEKMVVAGTGPGRGRRGISKWPVRAGGNARVGLSSNYPTRRTPPPDVGTPPPSIVGLAHFNPAPVQSEAGPTAPPCPADRRQTAPNHPPRLPKLAEIPFIQ